MSNQSDEKQIDIREHHLNNAGYIKLKLLSKTLQGAVYKAVQKSTNTNVVIKMTDKNLHNNSMSTDHQKVQENILSESIILKKLTKSNPKHIVKFIDLLQCDQNYYLVMQYGGRSLFDFIVRGHKLLDTGKLTINEWYKVIKRIFKQMIDCIEYIHSKGCVHFDISLANFVISEVQIYVSQNIKNPSESKIEFELDSINIKLIDFGLSEIKTDSFLSSKYCGKKNYQSPEIRNRKNKFDSKSNDIWCLGITLFLMCFGNCPWNVAHEEDVLFYFVCMYNGGNIVKLLKSWNKYKYIENNEDIIDLFESLFQFEKERITLDKIKNHSWLG